VTYTVGDYLRGQPKDLLLCSYVLINVHVRHMLEGNSGCPTTALDGISIGNAFQIQFSEKDVVCSN
jgi:hypothetical protein